MDIGFYVLDIDSQNSLKTKIISSINELCKNRPYDNIVLFNNQFNTIDIDHKYYILHIQQAKYFDGILFVFDTKSTMLTHTFPSPKKQVLYMNQPEWTDNTSLSYGFWHNIYMKNNIELITDNQATHDLINICWKPPLDILSDITGEELENVISKL